MNTTLISVDPKQLTDFIEKTITRAINDALNSRKDKEKLFSLKEASAYLNLSKLTIYSYTHRKCIPHFKKGKRLLFRKEDLDSWLEDGHSHKWKRTYTGVY